MAVEHLHAYVRRSQKEPGPEIHHQEDERHRLPELPHVSRRHLMPIGKSASLNAGQLTLSTTAALLVAQNLSRVMLMVTNDDASIKVYAGGTSGVTNTTGAVIKPGTPLVLDGYTGPLYLLSASATPTATYVEY